MPTVTVEPKLYKRVEEVAQKHQASIDDILAEAVRQYLWEQQRHKISEESRIYRQQHARLKEKYLGQYIAMHNGQVVDHDPDFAMLRERIRQKFEHTPVMITRVEDTAESEMARRGFRMETGIS